MKKLFAFALLFLPMICQGQMSGDFTRNDSLAYSWNFVSNISWASNHNVWHPSPVNLVQISSSGGMTGGLQANGNPCIFSDYPTNYWNCNTGMGAVHQLAVCSPQLTLALGTTPVSGGYPILQWNGSSWINASPFGGSLTWLACSAGGNLAGVNSFNQVFSGTVTAGWQTLTAAPGTATECSTNDNGPTFLCVINQQLWYYTFASGTWTNIGNAAHVSVDNLGIFYKIDTAGNAWRMTLIPPNITYTELAGGPFTSVANGGPLRVWAVGPTQNGNDIWRLSDKAMQIIGTYTTNTICPGGCSVPQHRPKASVCLDGTHHTGCQTTLGVYEPASNTQSVSASDTCTDVFQLFENSQTECVLDTTAPAGETDCTSVGGAIFVLAATSGVWQNPGPPTTPVDCFLDNNVPFGGVGLVYPGQLVNVYIDSNSFTSSEFQPICSGISLWQFANGNGYACHWQADPFNTIHPSSQPVVVVEGMDPQQNQFNQYGQEVEENAQGQVIAAGSTVTYEKMQIALVSPFTGKLLSPTEKGNVACHEGGHSNLVTDCLSPSVCGLPGGLGLNYCIGCELNGSCMATNNTLGEGVAENPQHPHTPTVCDYIWGQIYHAAP